MKSTFTHVMSFIMALLMVIQFVRAQEIVTTAPVLSVCPGTQNVEVPVTVQNLAGVYSISLTLGFNPSQITYTSYTANPALGGEGTMLLVNCPAPYDKIKAAYFGLTPLSLPDNAILFTFTFNVTGSSYLNWDLFTPGGCQYNDFDALPLPGSFVNGAINAVTPDANFASTPQICEGEIATVTIDFTGGTPPYIFQYNDGVNPDITDTSYTNQFVFQQTLSVSTNWNLLSIVDATGCMNSAVGKSTYTYVSPLANIFNVGGGGSTCENGDPLTITLDGSQPGLLYELYLDGTPTGFSQYGTGFPITFYGYYWNGNYTIMAENDCGTMLMNGFASIVVMPQPVVSLEPLAPVCYLSDAFELTGGSPAGGVYSGYGVENGYFHSEIYGPGSYFITYTYTDVNGCVNSASQELIVNGIPSVNFAYINPICGSNDSVILYGEPFGGVFSGPGVIDGIFYPVLAGNGIHILTYTVTNIEGCSNSTTQEAVVLPLPQITLDPISNVCANANTVALSALPLGGWFSGPGVSGDFFYPDVAGPGTWTITYNFMNEVGCSNSDSTQVIVMPVPQVDVLPIGPFCADASPVTLTGTPAGGSFNGEGVQNGQFFPNYAGTGIWPITYYFTDENGCTSYSGTDATVYALPEVFLDILNPVCVSGNAVSLYGWPDGGTYSGTGVQGNMFNPGLAGQGTFDIIYTYTDPQGCSNTALQSITVFDVPTAEFQLPLSACENSEAFELFPSPEGGWFEGNGIYGNWFYPSQAGPGVHQITYHYFDNNECGVNVTHEITVLSAPQIVIDPVAPLCADAVPVVLNASPAGGIFSGTGVENGSFNPSVTGPGSWPVNYSFTDLSGCSSVAIIFIDVNYIPQVYWDPVYAVCVNASPVELTAYPTGGTYSGPGVDNNFFYPAIAGVGTFNLTYTYTNEIGCTASADQEITVNASATPEFTLAATVCINADAFELIGSPTGGWFEGPGVYANYYYPSAAGPGTWTVTYHFQDENCEVSVSHDITVLSAPVINFAEISPLCVDHEPVSLSASPVGGVFSGPGVVDGSFSPAMAGAGYWEITYSITDENSCTSVASIWVVVNDLPQVALWGPEDICLDSDTVLLTGYPDGGQFYGTGLEGSYFNPAGLEPGPYIITYVYSNENGCSNYASLTINLHSLPQVSIVAPGSVCVNSDAVALTGTPEGGYFSGTEVWGSYFYPAWAGTGTYTITYTYTDANGCTNSDQTNITVNPITELTFGPLADVCVNASPVQLSALPVGGIFSGMGVDGNLFYPEIAGMGTTTITYTYINEFGCSSSIEANITVNNTTQVYFDPLADVCINSGVVELNAFPLGGTFSGTGVEGNTFNPSVAGTGTFTLMYLYSNEQCQGTAYQTITVLPVSEISFMLPSSVCVNAEAVALTATPEGGYYTGQGVYTNEFHPDLAGAGEWMITYTYTNAMGCTSEASTTITVIPGTEVSIDAVSPICQTSQSITLTGTPAGGVFYGPGVFDNTFDPIGMLPGTYTVYYSWDLNGCGGTDSTEIIINPVPEAWFSGSATICAGSSAMLTISITDGSLGPWSLGYSDGSIMLVTEPYYTFEVTPLVTTTYVLTSVTNAYGCSSILNIPVTVSVEPYPTSYMLTGGGNVCMDITSVDLTLSGSQPGFIYTLYYNGESTAYSISGTGEPLVFTIAPVVGIYSVYTSSPNACAVFMQGEATINFYTELFGSAGPDVTILQGSSTVLTATATGGVSPYTYFWYPGSSVDDQFSPNPVASPTTTTTYSLMVMDDAGCMAVDEVTVTVLEIQDDIHGTLTYFNEPMTPMNNCQVFLLQGGSEISSTLTDDNGNYSFMNLPFGTYSLKAATTKAWGGGNAIDGLLMLKHFVGQQILTGLKYEAADVSGEGIINAHDALNTMRRFVDFLPDYSPVGDWVFEQPTLTIDGYTAQFIDFKGLCMSDVNGDYLPPYIKPEPTILMNSKGFVNAVNDIISVPVVSEQSLTVGAISMVFDLPAGTEVTGVTIKGEKEDLFFKQQGTELRIAWCSLNPLYLNAGEPILTISIRNANIQANTSLQLDGSSTIADNNANVIKNSVFSVPLFSIANTELTLSNFPNPFNENTQIRYILPEDGKVSLYVYNFLGEKVAEIVNTDQISGEYQLNFDGSSLSQGSYFYKLELSNASHLLQKTAMMNIIK